MAIADKGNRSPAPVELEPLDVSRLQDAHFHALPHVVATNASDTTVLMDRVLEKYYALNEVSAEVWRLLGLGSTATEIAQHLSAEYEVPHKQVETDVASVLKEFHSSGLIAPGLQPEPTAQHLLPPSAKPVTRHSALQVPSVLRCGLAILGMKLALKALGFHGAIEWMRRQVESIVATEAADVDVVMATERAVAMAGALYPGRAKCLEQSLVLYFLLRRRGVAVRYCQGIQPYPFQAHAWVEYRGAVVNDVPEHTEAFSRFPDQLP